MRRRSGARTDCMASSLILIFRLTARQVLRRCYALAMKRSKPHKSARTAKNALRFVLVLGIVNFFADMTYEGASSINGQFLSTLGASAAAVGAKRFAQCPGISATARAILVGDVCWLRDQPIRRACA